jgi:hypothetical protein
LYRELQIRVRLLSTARCLAQAFSSGAELKSEGRADISLYGNKGSKAFRNFHVLLDSSSQLRD